MTAGAILCGGRSRRMGTDKAFVEIGGVAMVERVAAALDAAGCATVLLVGGDAPLLARTGHRTVADEWPGQGPAGGLLTALDALADELVVVASCDLPLLDAHAVRRVVSAVDGDPALGVAVAVTDRPQLSLTCWRRSVARHLVRARWDEGRRSLHEMVAAVPSVDVAVLPEAVRNVNTPEDLSGAEAVARYIGPMPVPEIDVEELAARLVDGARLIDVREPDEYTAGHVPGAVLVPLGTVPDHVDDFAGDGPTYVICGSGGRSMRAAELVADHGIEAVNVAGGTRAWIASGRDTVGGDQPT